MGGNGNGELKGRARRRGLKSCMIGWGGGKWIGPEGNV